MKICWMVVLALLVGHPVAHAASFLVTNTNDAGSGSLRNAITNANGAQGNNTILISATGTINLLSPLPTVSFTLTMAGPGADQLTIRRSAGTFPVLTISGTVQLSGVTIQDGDGGGGNGGGIVVQAGSLVLLDSTISGNSASLGSGIYSNGALTIRRSTISGNTGTGVIYSFDTTTVSDSTIADNQGTAIVFPPTARTLTIDRSTISGNTDASGIGGLQLQGGTANIRNTTFSSNSGPQGGDFWTFSDGVTLSLVNVTAVGSSAPALLFDHSATVTLRNTLFAGTGARCSLGSQPTSQGHNLSSDMTCNLIDATDKPGMDPVLGPLAANGGATKTHALLAGSPAVNAGDGTGLETLDQRGKPRIQFAAVDIGAVEVTEPIISSQPVQQDLVEGNAITLTVAAMNQNSATPLQFQWRKDDAPIAGATSDMFVKPDAQVEDSGMYDVLVINDGGSLASVKVAVNVTPAPMGDGAPGDSGSGSDDGGGCCSASGSGAGTNAMLGLLLAVILGTARRPSSQRRRR
jgi:hypothetical protein